MDIGRLSSVPVESFGITDPERLVLDKFQDKIHFTWGYEVSLSWKDLHASDTT